VVPAPGWDDPPALRGTSGSSALGMLPGAQHIERLLCEAGYDWNTQPGQGDEEKRDAEGNGPFCIVEAQVCPRMLAWLEVTVEADGWESHAETDMQNENASSSLLWGRERNHRRCPILNLHVEAANLDELWERL
jgi:hypothetical protein